MIKIIKRICWKKQGEMNRANSNIWKVQYQLQKKLVSLAKQLTEDLATKPGSWEEIDIIQLYQKKVNFVTAELDKCKAKVTQNHKIHSRWWSLEFFTVKKVLKALATPFVKIFNSLIRYPIHDLTWNIHFKRMEKEGKMGAGIIPMDKKFMKKYPIEAETSILTRTKN